MSKLYQYDDLKKTNQALGSFKRNEVKVEEVKFVVVEGKIQFFIVADPPYTPRPEDDKSKKKDNKELKTEEPKVEEPKAEEPKIKKPKVKKPKVEKNKEPKKEEEKK